MKHHTKHRHRAVAESKKWLSLISNILPDVNGLSEVKVLLVKW